MGGLAVAVTAMLLGSMVFFATIVAPVVFRFLPKDQRPKYLSGIFPRYYLWGAILAAVALVPAFLVDQTATALIACVLLGFFGVRQVLVPRIEVTREGRAAGNPAATEAFAKLHRISVHINLSQMFALLVSIILVEI